MAWYNPVSWFNAAANDALKTIDDVKHWVLTRVKQLADELWSDLQDLKGWATTALNDARKALGDFADLTEAALGNVAQLARDLAANVIKASEDFASQIGQDAGRALAHVESLAQGWIADLKDWAIDGFNDAAKALAAAERTAEHYADNVWAVAYRDVVKPLGEALAQDVRDLEHYADNVWAVADRDVVQPIERTLDTARHDIATAADWIAHEGEDAVKLVEGAADWLAALGKFALSDVEKLPSELESFFDPETWLVDLRMVGISAAESLGSYASRVFGHG